MRKCIFGLLLPIMLIVFLNWYISKKILERYIKLGDIVCEPF